MSEDITYAPGYIARDGTDIDDAQLDGIQFFKGAGYLPCSKFDGAVVTGHDGNHRIILYAQMLPPPAAGIAIPFSAVTARELAAALIAMATELETLAANQASEALKKAAGK